MVPGLAQRTAPWPQIRDANNPGPGGESVPNESCLIKETETHHPIHARAPAPAPLAAGLKFADA